MKFPFNFGGKKLGWPLSEHKTIRLADDRRVSSDTAKKMTVQIDELTKRLTAQKIEDWRYANQVAIDVENPKRNRLLAIYDDAMHDLHLKGAIRNRKLAVLSKPFKIVDAEGEKEIDLTALLRSKWFKQFLSFSLDARFWGHSLIQFDDIQRAPKLKFKGCEVVPREHVMPEFRVIVKNADDEAKKGMDYTQPPFSYWCLEVGDKKDLGELNSCCKEFISKKYILQFWDQFAEIFGMPLRIGKTNSRNPKDHAQIEDMLEQMGAAAWGVFPEGTTIEFQRDAKTDSYNVYDKRIDRANSEMSKAILGQTMTMDNGSSKSQAQVHENVADEIADADRDWLHDIVNDELLPFLIMHGYPLEGYEFKWDDTYEYTPGEMMEIEQMLLQYYDVDPEYFMDKYNVTLLGPKQQPVVVDDPKGQKKNLVSNLKGFYS